MFQAIDHVPNDHRITESRLGKPPRDDFLLNLAHLEQDPSVLDHKERELRALWIRWILLPDEMPDDLVETRLIPDKFDFPSSSSPSQSSAGSLSPE